MLLAVLAQKGGEVVVTEGTLEQVNANYDGLGFVVTANTEKKEFIVKLVAGRDEAEPAVGETVSGTEDAPGETANV